ncbi:MAG: hypothetical protein CO028_04130 [Candidatus Levybacteria bacterium CG_4_9_14_0_2_um_filter_35_21]|nr:MAG: hypothetical protein COW87_02720 [Candidatus Levybacteria bacterium CG22_combo_CG10-13_8_21_14_all_35_11]PJC54125.1 MAG: hypothetical protein CO028_04130 [Candidatus Levybacteria bacterium CG_4_9_14_0_2_um_filter_35_21]
MKKVASLIRRYNTNEYRNLFLIVSIFFVIFTTISIHRFWQYSVWYYDFGIFYTAISAVSKLQAPIIDHFVFTNTNILGDHFHPIIFLISPLVALFKTGEVLLVIQTLFVSLSGIFIYLISKHYQRSKFESFAMLIMYFSFIGLHNALITEFHEITLLSLPLSIFFYGMIKKKKFWYFLGLFSVLLTKETTFIIPAWFSLLLIFKNKGQWRKIGLFSLLISLAYGYFLVTYVFKFFNGEGYYYLEGASKNVESIFPTFNELKIKTIFYSFLNFGFLPLLAPEMLPPILFNWWSRFTSLASTRHDLGMHYNSEIAPTLILAANVGWVRLKMFLSKFFPFFKTYYFKILFLIVVVISFINIIYLNSPILLFGNLDFYKNTENFVFLDTLIENIPEDGIVMAETNIAARIAYRGKVIMLRDNYDQFSPDYVVVDFREGQEPNNFFGVDFPDFKSKIYNDPTYFIYYDQGEQVIFKKIKKD